MTEQVRKPIEQLQSEQQKARPFWNKNFIHKKSGGSYQLITTAHDEETQVLMAVYALNANTQMKFVRPFDVFMEKFEEGHASR